MISFDFRYKRKKRQHRQRPSYHLVKSLQEYLTVCIDFWAKSVSKLLKVHFALRPSQAMVLHLSETQQLNADMKSPQRRIHQCTVELTGTVAVRSRKVCVKLAVPRIRMS